MALEHRFLAAAGGLLLAAGLAADPCGMVPPISIQGGKNLTRVGVQRTYVFHRDGIETFVIRPGFEGTVAEFGMLTPFPSPPAIRKAPDEVFEHIAAAIDPPEVLIQTFAFGAGMGGGGGLGGGGGGGLGGGGGGLKIARDEVRVLKEEGVGMYAMAVLQAGSAEALRKWMLAHQYIFPAGMEPVCEDYIRRGWCFVAGKNRVAPKADVQPRPGQKGIDAKLPDKGAFDGHIQAMAFRFRTPKLEIPMRLSAFNAGPHHNVVYLLADGPKKLDGLPEKFVVRQVPGNLLEKHLTEYLPVRLAAGSDVRDVQPQQWVDIRTKRNPDPALGIARDLIAADLLAVREGRLAHPHEEEEKKLLAICERLDLRGPAIDSELRTALARERADTVRQAVRDVRGMTMTVIDGDFPVALLAKQDLTASAFVMDDTKNDSRFYDPKADGPSPPKNGQLLSMAEIPAEAPTALDAADPSRMSPRTVLAGLMALGGLLIAAGGLPSRNLRRWLPWGGGLGALLLTVGLYAAYSPAPPAPLGDLVPLLDELGKAEGAAKQIVARGPAAVPEIAAEALAGSTLSRRGWAIVCLGELGGPQAEGHLRNLMADGQEPMLVRTWAAGAYLQRPGTWREVRQRFVGPRGPIAEPLAKNLLADPKIGNDPAALARLAFVDEGFRDALLPAVAALGPERLVALALKEPNDEFRRFVAGILGGVAEKQPQQVAAALAAALAFDAKAEHVPWAGGALFLPTIPAWPEAEHRKTYLALERWIAWCDQRRLQAEALQAHNALAALPSIAAQTPQAAPATPGPRGRSKTARNDADL